VAVEKPQHQPGHCQMSARAPARWSATWPSGHAVAARPRF